MLLRAALVCSTLLVTSGCRERLSLIHPAGPAAQTIADLWWIMLAGAVVVFALVIGLLALAYCSPAANPAVTPAPNPAPNPAASPDLPDDEPGLRLWMWGFGLAFPLTVLSALTLYGVFVGERLLPRAAPDLVTVQAEARQWSWTFGYAEVPGLTTENVLHIPAGRPVDVEITSLDVIHAFWVPRLAGKLDAIPGHVNVLRIEAADPGTYAGQSAEFSGTGYRDHIFAVQAHDPASWATFLREGPP